MAIYLLTVASTSSGHTLQHGANAMVVHAASETQAKQIAASKFNSDGSVWASATVTEMATTDDWEGWTFEINIHTSPVKTFTYVSTSTNDTIDEIGAALVTLLNADADIAGAAYNTTSQTLTIAETTDNLGDKGVSVNVTPPSGVSPIASVVGTITSGGASSAALSVVLSADALVPPKVLAYLKTV
jgi:hypothetical protein